MPGEIFVEFIVVQEQFGFVVRARDQDSEMLFDVAMFETAGFALSLCDKLNNATAQTFDQLVSTL